MVAAEVRKTVGDFEETFPEKEKGQQSIGLLTW
jgi:hypothetical protein